MIKAGISYVSIQINNKRENYNLLDNYNEVVDEFTELSELEIKCNYIEIDKKISSLNNKNTKAFYLFKIQEFEKARECLEELKENVLNNDIYDLLLFKFNLGLINQLIFFDDKGNYGDFRYIYENIAKETMCELNYLNDIFNNNKDQILKLSRLKEDHIRKYLKLDNSVQLGDVRYDLYKMMSIVYDYYFYIRENGVYLDYFNNMEKFFEPYIEATISTYSPKTQRTRTNTVFPDDNKYDSYIFNRFDLDIIIKHSSYKKIKEILSKYEVKEIEYEANINIVEILKNLCQYIKLKPNRFNIEYLKKFVLLLTVINLRKMDINRVLRILEDVLINRDENLHSYIFIEINEDLSCIINRNSEKINTNSFEIVINELFTEEVYKQLDGQGKTGAIFSFLNSVNTFSYDLYKRKIDKIIEDNNIKYISGLSKLLSNEQRGKISKNILSSMDNININTVIHFIFDNVIEYNEIIESKILSEVELHASSRIKNPGVRTFPDSLTSLLEYIIVLFLLDKGVNIFKFEKYIEYNDVLYFIINPSKFDYKKIALDNLNWMNVMRDEKYLKIIIDKAKDVMNKKLKYNIDNGFANEEQTRLYYKYFE